MCSKFEMRAPIGSQKREWFLKYPDLKTIEKVSQMLLPVEKNENNPKNKYCEFEIGVVIGSQQQSG